MPSKTPVVRCSADNRGILNTSGIQTQAWSTDGHETLRKALTKLQQQGATNEVVSSSPPTPTSPPTAAAARPRHTAPQCCPVGASRWSSRRAGDPAERGFDALRLYTDGQIAVEWNTSARCNANEVTARCEGRFGVAVRKPLLVVSVHMSAL